MTYNPGIPNATDLISSSQGQIKTNFSQLDTLYALDHYAFDDATAANRGYHKKVTIRAVLGADPNLASPIGSVYTKTSGGKSQLFYQNNTTSGDVYQLTSDRTAYTPTVTQAGTGGAIAFTGLSTTGASWKVGKITFVYATATWSSSGGYTGNIRISLPSTPGSASYGFASSSNGGATISPFNTNAYVIPAAATTSGFSTSINVVNAVSGGSIVISGWYQ